MTRMPQRTIPKTAGIGLRSRHIAEMLTRRPSAGWLEVHAENYMGESAQVSALEKLRQIYPLSVHGVGLSLGSANGLDRDHLRRLADVVTRFEPDLVSEHLAWSVADGAYLNDLLPLRYDEAALGIVAHNVELVQDMLKRQVLIENLSAYVEFAGSTMTEAEFLAGLVKRTGCGLLLDVNNVYVSAHNLGFDAARFIDTLPAEAIGEIHLAGHAVNQVGEDTVLIDDHGSGGHPQARPAPDADRVGHGGARARCAARRGDVGRHARRVADLRAQPQSAADIVNAGGAAAQHRRALRPHGAHRPDAGARSFRDRQGDRARRSL
jgi:uncharacterized protein (UPF0276 family)